MKENEKQVNNSINLLVISKMAREKKKKLQCRHVSFAVRQF